MYASWTPWPTRRYLSKEQEDAYRACRSTLSEYAIEYLIKNGRKSWYCLGERHFSKNNQVECHWDNWGLPCGGVFSSIWGRYRPVEAYCMVEACHDFILSPLVSLCWKLLQWKWDQLATLLKSESWRLDSAQRGPQLNMWYDENTTTQQFMFKMINPIFSQRHDQRPKSMKLQRIAK